MAWRPYVGPAPSSPTESAAARETTTDSIQRQTLFALRDILAELRLMNARLEAGLESGIEGADL